MSFRAVWALWLAWVSMEVPAWTSTFHLARFVVSCATSTSEMVLMADCRLVWLVVSSVLGEAEPALFGAVDGAHRRDVLDRVGDVGDRQLAERADVGGGQRADARRVLLPGLAG